MTTTYRAVQVSEPNRLELVERAVPTPGEGEVLIAVEACGICGADANDIGRAEAVGRIPGHEVVGRIIALGRGTPSLWRLKQRVGVGRLGGHCNACAACRQGRFNLCRNQPFVGSSCDGGYAELMVARSTGLVSIPDELGSEEAAPILCAGLATFNALKKSGAEAGDTVAVLGVGGLGHMAIQYARKMGFRVVAIGRGSDIEFEAGQLGAHHYIDAATEDAAARLIDLGGVAALVATIGDGKVISPLVASLAPGGRLVLLGAGGDPVCVPAGQLVATERSMVGSITGSPFDNEKTLAFSVLADVRPRIETVPLERAVEGFQRMRTGEAKFRMVLTMGGRFADQ